MPNLVIILCIDQPAFDGKVRDELVDDGFQQILIADYNEFLVLQVIFAKVFVDHYQCLLCRITG